MTTDDELLAFFDKFESAGELLGFLFKEHGERVFRIYLDLEPTNLTQPFCLKAADELAAVGMTRASEIVRERAATVPPDNRYCPMWSDATSVHSQHWLKQQKAQYEDYDEAKIHWGSSS